MKGEEAKTKDYLEGFKIGKSIKINGKSEFYLKNITKLKFINDPLGISAINFENGLYEGYRQDSLACEK